LKLQAEWAGRFAELTSPVARDDAVASRTDPQLAFSYARPKPRKGGLELEAHNALVEQLRGDARRIAEHFRLPPFELEADRPDARSRYGQCDSNGRILVRLVNVRTGRGLKYSALVDTVVHELAHLRHMNHGPRWEALYQRMLVWSRNQGIYQPRATQATQATPHSSGSMRAPGIEQLALFVSAI